MRVSVYFNGLLTVWMGDCRCQDGGVIKCGHINLNTARPTQFIVFILSKPTFFPLHSDCMDIVFFVVVRSI